MAVSPLLNDLALAAATDRSVASRKTAPKEREGDFSSTLSATHRNNAELNAVSKRSPQARPQAKHDPRDHRSSEFQKSNASRHDRHELKANAHHDEARHQARHDSHVDHDHSTQDRHAYGHSNLKENSKPQDQTQDKTAETIGDTDQTVVNDTSTVESADKSKAENADKLSATVLDSSALLQPNTTVAPQLIQSSGIPYEVQNAAALVGTQLSEAKAATAVSDDGTVDETVAGPAEQTSTKANASTLSVGLNIVQTLAEAKTSTAKSELSDALAPKANAETSAALSSVKSAASDKTDGAEAKATLATFELGNAPSSQGNVERPFAGSEQPSAKQTFTEALVATSSNKSADGINGISTLAASSPEASQGLKSPAATPAEALARADSPVPLQSVAVEIGMRAMRGSKEFSIRLDPEDLGRIDIKLEISEAGEVQAKLTVDRVETLQLLQRDAKTLERAFDQAGLKSNPDGLQFSLRDPGQQRDGQNGQQSERPKFNGSDKEILRIDETPAMRSFRYSSPATSGLDIRI